MPRDFIYIVFYFFHTVVTVLIQIIFLRQKIGISELKVGAIFKALDNYFVRALQFFGLQVTENQFKLA